MIQTCIRRTTALFRGLLPVAVMAWFCPLAGAADAKTPTPLLEVGVATIDITPQFPIRLQGFPRGPRAEELSMIAMPLHAKAIAIGSDAQQPVVVVSVDLLGVSASMTDELASRLMRRTGLVDRTRLTLAATHNHSAPAVDTVIPYIFRKEPTEQQAAHIRQYHAWLMDQLEKVAIDALQNRRPARLTFSQGSADFAVNRRMLKDGKWAGFGENPDGPVDHDLSLFAVTAPDGTLRAVWANYACHGVCWQEPSVHGDWMGSARQKLEVAHPGAIAMITIGCAGDQNPIGLRDGMAETHGETISREVDRLLAGPQQTLSEPPGARRRQLALPLGPADDYTDDSQPDDWYGRVVRQALASGQPLPETMPYEVQTWTFGDEFAMVFLAGEMMAEYSLRLKRELDASRLWVSAYANAMPAYIPSARMIAEGGYEVDQSRRSFGWPAPLAPETEDLIIDAVHDLLPATYKKPAPGAQAADRETGGPWWQDNGHPRGAWWENSPVYQGAEADKIWERVPIPPSPVLSPEQALQSFVVAEGFRVEVVAAEPLVVRPVHMRFDPAGRLWVVELTGFMRDIAGRGESEPTGRVVVLEDLDGDGRMDKSTPFLEGLVMPRTIAFVEGGVLVVEPPVIWHARDTDGDLVCDEKTQVAGDYGVAGDPEHSANGLMPALDNWMYSAKSATRHRFVDGRLIAGPTLFRGQWGIAQDDTGRLFYNYNASPLHTEIFPGQYVLGIQDSDTFTRRSARDNPAVNVSIVNDKSVHPVRVTPMVTLGATDLRPDGTLQQFTAACAPLVYRGDQFPAEFAGDAFVCEPVGNLVKRFDLEMDGLAIRAIPADANGEFLASKDERFRPVHLEVGPDGALYIADMYTGVIEHKKYVTEYLRNQALSRGLSEFTATGRIYRIVADDQPRHPPVMMANADSAALLAHLSSPNGWVRDTAQRLLVERRDTAIIPALRRAARDSASPLGRLHALWTCEGLDAIDRSTVYTALGDDDWRVRSAALRIGERFLGPGNDEMKTSYLALAADPDPRVRMQSILSLGESGERWAEDAIVAVLNEREEPMLAAAAEAALRGRELGFITRSLERRDWTQPSGSRALLLEQLARVILQHQVPSEIFSLLDLVGNLPGDEWRIAAVRRGLATARPPARPLLLATEPALMATLRASKNSDDRMLADALGKQVTWKGDPQRRMPPPPLTAAEAKLFELGRAQYALCAACHQGNGQGLAGLAPPLAGSPWVTGSSESVIKIVLHGLSGPIEVMGQAWDMNMPGLGSISGMLDDEKIAGIVTYIRRQWGNDASVVTPSQVASVRAATADRQAPWTAAELAPSSNAGTP